MISVPIWVFVLICVLAFVGTCIFIMLIVMTIYALVEKHYEIKEQEEKLKANQCPEKVE